MNHSKLKNIKGLILATSVVIGTVIGTGIFFKNKSMISWAHGNAWLVIGAWIIGSIVAFAAAVSFSQIARKTKNNNSGIGQLTEEMISKKVGWHTKINWPFFYFPWNVFLISLYASDYIIKVATGTGAYDHTIIALILALSILIVIVVINIIWTKIGGWIQISATVIKIIPLIILALSAFVVVFVMPDTNWWHGTNHKEIPYDPTIGSDTNGMSPLLILVFIIPGTLFAYDSFLNATNVSESVNKKHVTYAIVGGMTFIAIIYLLVTIAILSTGTLNADDALIKVFGGNPNNPTILAKVMEKIIQMFIVISALGGLNGFCFAWVQATKSILKKPTTKNTFIVHIISFIIIVLPLLFITLTIWGLNIVPGHANANSSGRHIGITFADALSNPLIIISYTIYALTLLFAVKRNIQVKDKSKKYARWFNTSALLSSITILLILCYILFYSILYKSLSNLSTDTFGGLPGWVFLIIVTFYVILWITLPFIVNKLTKSKSFLIDIQNNNLK